MSTNPEKDLEEFLAPLPLYVQKSLWYDPSKSGEDQSKESFDELHRKLPFSENELQAFRSISGWEPSRITATFDKGDVLTQFLARELITLRGWQPSPPVKELRPQFERILQRIPSKWKLYRKSAKAWRERVADTIIPIPKGEPGRPRKDSEAEQLANEHERKSYAEIAKARLMAVGLLPPDLNPAQKELAIIKESERIRKLLASRRTKRHRRKSD